jgi:hypothetical protein
MVVWDSGDDVWWNQTVFCTIRIFATDVDLDVRIDLQDLHDEFDLMTSSQMIGVVNDQEYNNKVHEKDFLLREVIF